MKYVIPSFIDKNKGYLNIASTYPFTLDDKLWPSVEHYRLAKRFEGSVLEEKIRNAKSAALARKLATPRSFIKDEDGYILKEVRYGSENCFMRDDWKTQEKISIENGILAKFSQNPKILSKLIATEGLLLIDNKIPYHGFALCKARDFFINNHHTTKIEFPKSEEDISSKSLTDNEITHLKNLFSIAKHIKKMEGMSHITPDTIHDSLYNKIITNPKQILKEIDKWSDTITWSFIVKHMPNYEFLIQQIIKYILDNHSSSSEVKSDERLQISIKIASVLKWNRFSKILKIQKISNLFIPPLKRKYRSSPPKKLFLKKSVNERGSLYISLFEKYIEKDQFSKITNHFEKMNPIKRNIELEIFSEKKDDDKIKYVRSILK